MKLPTALRQKRRREAILRAYAPCDTAAKRAATVGEGIARVDRVWSAGEGLGLAVVDRSP